MIKRYTSLRITYYIYSS